MVDREPVALVGFARAALKVEGRDASIGWTADQRAGTIYARDGFTYRGDTVGFRRQAPGDTAQDQPKRVYLRPLRRQAFALVPRVFDARAVGRRPAGGPQPAAAGRPPGAGGGGGAVIRWRPRGRSRCGV